MTILNEDLLYINNNLTKKEKGFYKDTVILITGCAGSLGYELVHFLLQYSNAKRIIGIDNCCLGYPKWLKRLVKNNSIDFYKEDISAIDLHSIIDSDKVDIVFHMASVASPISYRSLPLITMEANVGGCINLLQYYKDKKLRNFCFFSSSEVYGSPDDANIPTNESFYGYVNTVGPRSCYDEAKRYSETICYEYSQKHQIPCTILRPFNVFGPGMKLNDKRIPSDCISAILNNERIQLYSDGTPTRTFCYVSDAIIWILKATYNNAFEVFNIGMDKPEMTMYDFASLCAEIGKKKYNYSKAIQYSVSSDKNYLVDNPRRRCPDLANSQKKLEFCPHITTRQGIERFLDFLTEYGTDLMEEWQW